jgi:hypothetical protein
VISIQTGLVVLTVFVNPVHLDNMGNEVRGHLDVQMGLNATRASAPPAHGILGQTVDPSVTSPVKVAPQPSVNITPLLDGLVSRST